MVERGTPDDQLTQIAVDSGLNSAINQLVKDYQIDLPTAVRLVVSAASKWIAKTLDDL
jgi:hypothetical protein